MEMLYETGSPCCHYMLLSCPSFISHCLSIIKVDMER